MKQIPAVFLMSAAMAACSHPRAAAIPDGGVEPIPVVVAPVAMADVGNAVDAGGVVQAATTATIAARILAPVREVRVQPGDRVRRGQTLVVLDAADLPAAARAAQSSAVAAEQGAELADAELQAAQASLTLARVSHDRMAGLHSRRSATAQELDEAVAVLRSAEARVTAATARQRQSGSAIESARALRDQASQVASFTTLVAPFDGVVTEKLTEPGNTATPGMPLIRLEDTRAFRLEVRIDESRASQVHLGDVLPVSLSSREDPVRGTVDEISRAMDTDARAFLIKIALPATAGLRSGEFGKVRLRGASRRALTVPSTAVVRRGQLTYVYVVDQGVARMRLVSLSDEEVLAGLTESDRVVVSPQAALTDGRSVRIGGR